ncbi:FAD-binding oxidoreductase [Polaromonas sp. JS666]|uniref:FAD-binding oxidoreductase n=1 Tax=Polaromonas sp. (strain JS666 / ATCC BAA-500) TaxID=296591 RepID=UPI0000464BD5|nr:FAD-binding oxidoreductase [Polaromonas sp. JS666]ABE43454.1 FAD linked oxidase-like protein [Polaromonas sp. JS666]
MTKLQATRIEALKGNFKGQVILPDDDLYESARKVWNATIDKHPALIARCATTSDVVGAVNFAKDNGLVLAVRGGGHNIAGSALCDDGIIIDLSQMKAAHVDAGSLRGTIEGGATLADFDAATQAHGLALPLGINSTTGVAGLTLGGGFGWLSRKYGMTIDNLESAEVVTAAGEVVRASATEHPDLFWALRGGSGNFGVVTRFEFRLHPVGPNVLSGLIVYPLSEAKAVLQQYREFMAKAPDELSVWVVLRQAPPLPFLSEKVHGKEIIALALLYAGDPKQGESLIEPLRKFGTPLGEHVGVQPYTAWQQAFDPLLTPGARNYWKSHNFSVLDDGLFEAVIEYIKKLPSPQCEIFFGAIGGATMRPAPDSSAYAHRDARFVMNVHGRWTDPADDERCIGWARDYFKASAPFASGGVYVNFLTADEGDRVKAAYGQNYDRLAQIKRKYDPTNLFSTNQNIKPA